MMTIKITGEDAEYFIDRDGTITVSADNINIENINEKESSMKEFSKWINEVNTFMRKCKCC